MLDLTEEELTKKTGQADERFRAEKMEGGIRKNSEREWVERDLRENRSIRGKSMKALLSSGFESVANQLKLIKILIRLISRGML